MILKKVKKVLKRKKKKKKSRNRIASKIAPLFPFLKSAKNKSK
jgi:hypothetical protein